MTRLKHLLRLHNTKQESHKEGALHKISFLHLSQCSDWVTGWTAEVCGSWQRKQTRPDGLWDAPSLLFNGYQGPSSGIRRSGREANHSPPSSAEVKNVWSSTCTLPIGLHGVVLS